MHSVSDAGFCLCKYIFLCILFLRIVSFWNTSLLNKKKKGETHLSLLSEVLVPLLGEGIFRDIAILTVFKVWVPNTQLLGWKNGSQSAEVLSVSHA